MKSLNNKTLACLLAAGLFFSCFGLAFAMLPPGGGGNDFEYAASSVSCEFDSNGGLTLFLKFDSRDLDDLWLWRSDDGGGSWYQYWNNTVVNPDNPVGNTNYNYEIFPGQGSNNGLLRITVLDPARDFPPGARLSVDAPNASSKMDRVLDVDVGSQTVSHRDDYPDNWIADLIAYKFTGSGQLILEFSIGSDFGELKTTRWVPGGEGWGPYQDQETFEIIPGVGKLIADCPRNDLLSITVPDPYGEFPGAAPTLLLFTVPGMLDYRISVDMGSRSVSEWDEGTNYEEPGWAARLLYCEFGGSGELIMYFSFEGRLDDLWILRADADSYGLVAPWYMYWTALGMFPGTGKLNLVVPEVGILRITVPDPYGEFPDDVRISLSLPGKKECIVFIDLEGEWIDDEGIIGDRTGANRFPQEKKEDSAENANGSGGDSGGGGGNTPAPPSSNTDTANAGNNSNGGSNAGNNNNVGSNNAGNSNNAAGGANAAGGNNNGGNNSNAGDSNAGGSSTSGIGDELSGNGADAEGSGSTGTLSGEDPAKAPLSKPLAAAGIAALAFFGANAWIRHFRLRRP